MCVHVLHMPEFVYTPDSIRIQHDMLLVRASSLLEYESIRYVTRYEKTIFKKKRKTKLPLSVHRMALDVAEVAKWM